MRQALALAYGVRAHTGDNPPVGCVIVCAGRILAEGATGRPGEAHAEAIAIQRAEACGWNPALCALYVSLEPCTFTGRTPPCVEQIRKHRPARVIVGMRDPHPRVCGRGIAILRQAGIPVVEGVLEEEIAQLLAPWKEHCARERLRGGSVIF